VALSPASIRLTQLSHGAGCACKISAASLRPILAGLPVQESADLLIGSETADDAAVYRLGDDLALVSSVDFFTPIVDDPYDFGRIAAANALSDLYAMGARPVLALNLVAFPLERLASDVLAAILAGGAAVAAEAGAAVGGGHSIDDPEPKYGMSVTGIVHPDRILTNAGGQLGDLLFLTKPIGGGLITTAAKRGLAAPGLVRDAVTVMTTLNADSSRAALGAEAHAGTDVTGFGLLGHLRELCSASGCAAEVEAAAVPAIRGALELARSPESHAGGSKRNAADARGFASFANGVEAARRTLLSDAMTSGGLLLAVAEQQAHRAPGTLIGRLVDGPAGTISVV